MERTPDRPPLPASLIRLAAQEDARVAAAAAERRAKLRVDLAAVLVPAETCHAETVRQLKVADAHCAQLRDAWTAACADREALRLTREQEGSRIGARRQELHVALNGVAIAGGEWIEPPKAA